MREEKTQTDREALVGEGLRRVRDVVQFLGVSRTQVYRMMDRGILPYVKLGKSRRVPWQAVLDLAKENLVVSDAE